MLKSCIIAFSTYSRIPMPKVEWSPKNMKFAMCFFPMVGAVIGILIYGFYYFSHSITIGTILRAAVLTVLPVLITGGIHMDGYLDTIDAKSSYGSREKKLEILKDPHAGAFAMIGCAAYFIISFGFWSEVTDWSIPIISVGFIYSRAFSGLGVVSLKGAKAQGLLATFSDHAQKKIVQWVMAILLFVCAAVMIGINAVIGGACAVAGILVFLYYRWMAYRDFGGITGDLAGYFLQIFELVMLITAVCAGKIL